MDQPTQPAGTMCHSSPPAQVPACPGQTFNIFGCNCSPKLELLLGKIVTTLEKLMSNVDQAASDIAAIKNEEVVIKAFLSGIKDQSALIDSLNQKIADMTAADSAQQAQLDALAADAAAAKAGQDELVALLPAQPAAPPA